MDIVFKAINNKSYTYNVNSDDIISSVFDKLAMDANIDRQTNNFKIIYHGKILIHEQKFSEFTLPPNPKDKLTFIFMATKIKPVSIKTDNLPTTPLIPPIPPPNQNNSTFLQSLISNDDNNSASSTSTDEYNTLDETDKTRASLIGLLVFIRANPQFVELFNNNFETLVQVIMSPQFKPFFDRMINDTSNQDSEYLDNLTDSVFDTNTNTNSESISLTPEDVNNIGTLEALGFPKQECIQAYVLSNKNIDIAASMLMDM